MPASTAPSATVSMNSWTISSRRPCRRAATSLPRRADSSRNVPLIACPVHLNRYFETHITSINISESHRMPNDENTGSVEVFDEY
jgi:hypothetical protein